jgi:hypothetical protein
MFGKAEMSFCHPPVSLSIYVPFCAFAMDMPPMFFMSTMYVRMTQATGSNCAL